MKYPSLAAATLFLCLLLLGGCSQIQLRTAWELRGVDYLTVNAGQFRLALALPDGALLDTVSMRLAFSHDGVVELDHDIRLDILTVGREVDRVNFPPTVSNGVVLRLPASRLDDVVDYQRRLLQARETGESASASMGVDTRLNQESLIQACAAGAMELRIQAWILVDDADGYLPLIGDSEISSLVDAQSEGFCPQQRVPG
ncbi:MAG: hypothetical protein V7700_10195 [Halioglobus sp.]